VPKSVRTSLHIINKEDFSKFLNETGLDDFKVGSYRVYYKEHALAVSDYLCYTYPNGTQNEDTLLALTLKFGNLVEAFNDYKKRKRIIKI